MRQRMLNGDNDDNELSNKAKSTKTALRSAKQMKDPLNKFCVGAAPWDKHWRASHEIWAVVGILVFKNKFLRGTFARFWRKSHFLKRDQEIKFCNFSHDWKSNKELEASFRFQIITFSRIQTHLVRTFRKALKGCQNRWGFLLFWRTQHQNGQVVE